ncbi:hypothetical protein CU097_006404 [Rhizopus azygosporus]|uniref:Uncharacterized protein n=1 Tax=Rhizopus azygosporus TaxID=86630 RepID=A0A367JQZ4_RHIAZ|nr:hypothetical protein CU097_006404 [Rhizopus azygosporus]
MPVININDNLITRIIPEYYDEVVAIRFVNEAGFEEWKAQEKKESEVSTKKARTKESIKIGCPSYISKHLLTDSAVEVKYRWEYPDHNLYDVQEIISSRLPSEVKQWIEELKDSPEGLNDLASTLRQSISIVESICSVPQSRPARQQ